MKRWMLCSRTKLCLLKNAGQCDNVSVCRGKCKEWNVKFAQNVTFAIQSIFQCAGLGHQLDGQTFWDYAGWHFLSRNFHQCHTWYMEQQKPTVTFTCLGTWCCNNFLGEHRTSPELKFLQPRKIFGPIETFPIIFIPIDKISFNFKEKTDNDSIILV